MLVWLDLIEAVVTKREIIMIEDTVRTLTVVRAEQMKRWANSQEGAETGDTRGQLELLLHHSAILVVNLTEYIEGFKEC